ncbi:MAG: hypothetical protein ABFC18_03255 [Rikenellaceae bacterium]
MKEAIQKMRKVNIERKALMHIAFSTEHIMRYQYLVTYKHLLNPIVFYSEHITKKRKNGFGEFGKTSSIYYFPDTPKGKEFHDIKELLAFKKWIINENKL